MHRVQQQEQENGTQTTQVFLAYKKCTQRTYFAARNKINEINLTSAMIQPASKAPSFRDVQPTQDQNLNLRYTSQPQWNQRRIVHVVPPDV